MEITRTSLSVIRMGTGGTVGIGRCILVSCVTCTGVTGEGVGACGVFVTVVFARDTFVRLLHACSTTWIWVVSVGAETLSIFAFLVVAAFNVVTWIFVFASAAIDWDVIFFAFTLEPLTLVSTAHVSATSTVGVALILVAVLNAFPVGHSVTSPTFALVTGTLVSAVGVGRTGVGRFALILVADWNACAVILNVSGVTKA